jgi:hypothetical protein
LAAKGYFLGQKDWDWPEALEIEYETDKPDFDGYGAVQVWAAYAEQPTVARPEGFSRAWPEDTVYGQVSRQPTTFGHVIGPELWLPVVFERVFEAEEPNGNRPKIGSVFTLRSQLRHLNELTWNANDDAIRSWRQDDFEPERLESMARWGFSILFCLTEFAAEKRLPMRLDY